MSVDEAEVEKLLILQLRELYDEFLKTAVHVPLPTDDGTLSHSTWAAYKSASGDDKPFGVTCDPRLINEALSAEVRLTFRTEEWLSKADNPLVRYHLESARLTPVKNPASAISREVAGSVHHGGAR
ncbi:MAG: hypothetical protein R3C02_24625 [Planctomycetaceae bacterium]